MSNSPINASGISSNFAQFKMHALHSMMASEAASNASTDLFSTLANTSASGLFEKMLAAAKKTEPATPTSPSGLDASRPFSRPGQNVVTVINRVEVSFKAQFSELSALKMSLGHEQDAAQNLRAINLQTSDADIKSALTNFIESYNAGVSRFAPDVAPGGVLEGSQEAIRARFATQRDISNPLIGANGGLKDGMRALGISIDSSTGLAALNEAQLNAALAQNDDADVRTIVDFATSFIATIANLNAECHPQQRQLTNLNRAIDWIAANRDAVQQEFGPGKAATPNDVFAKAAAAYDLIAK